MLSLWEMKSSQDSLSPKTCSVVGYICLNHADEIHKNRSTDFSLNTGAKTVCLTPQSVFVPWELLSLLLLFGENIFEMKHCWKVTHLQPASDLLFGNLCKNTDFWKSINFVVTNDPDTSARLKATLPIRCLFRPAETDWLTVFKWFLAYDKQQFWQEDFTGLLN